MFQINVKGLHYIYALCHNINILLWWAIYAKRHYNVMHWNLLRRSATSMLGKTDVSDTCFFIISRAMWGMTISHWHISLPMKCLNTTVTQMMRDKFLKCLFELRITQISLQDLSAFIHCESCESYIVM